MYWHQLQLAENSYEMPDSSSSSVGLAELIYFQASILAGGQIVPTSSRKEMVMLLPWRDDWKSAKDVEILEAMLLSGWTVRDVRKYVPRPSWKIQAKIKKIESFFLLFFFCGNERTRMLRALCDVIIQYVCLQYIPAVSHHAALHDCIIALWYRVCTSADPELLCILINHTTYLGMARNCTAILQIVGDIE